MTIYPRPVQPGSYHGLHCWLLTADQLETQHLGLMVFGATSEGVLESFEPSDRPGYMILTLNASTGSVAIEVLASKQLAVLISDQSGPSDSLKP